MGGWFPIAQPFIMSEETEFITYSMPDGTQVFSDIGYPKQLQSESQNQFERIYAFLRKEIDLHGQISLFPSITINVLFMG